MLSREESEYLKTQRLARVATASRDGTPEVSPVGFEFDGKYFWIGTHDPKFFPLTRRVRNIRGGNNRVELVIDDLASTDPWRPRGVKVRGTAEIMEHRGMFGEGEYVRINPTVSISWGVEPPKEGKWRSFKKWPPTPR